MFLKVTTADSLQERQKEKQEQRRSVSARVAEPGRGCDLYTKTMHMGVGQG